MLGAGYNFHGGLVETIGRVLLVRLILVFVRNLLHHHFSHLLIAQLEGE